MFSVKYTSRSGGAFPVFYGAPGMCMNGGGDRPSRSCDYSIHAVRFEDREDADVRTPDCNEKWSGCVVPSDKDGRGPIFVSPQPGKCPECGETPEEDYITGERWPVLKCQDGVLRCGRCYLAKRREQMDAGMKMSERLV